MLEDMFAHEGGSHKSASRKPARAPRRNIWLTVFVGTVVFIYDVWCTIPSNRLQRLILQGVDSVGAIETVIDVTRYQTIHEVILKGFPFFKTIRVITYNYADEIESNQHIALLGMYSSLSEYGQYS